MENNASSSNVEADETEILRLQYNITDSVITQNVYSHINLSNIDNESNLHENEFPNELLELQNIDELGETTYDALEYWAGYIIKKLDCENDGQITSREKNQNSWTWVNEVSKGGLIKPSQEIMLKLKLLEQIFIKLNDKNINIRCDYLKYHFNECDKIDILENMPENVKLLFFKCRLYFRLRMLNRCLRKEKNKKKKITKTFT